MILHNGEPLLSNSFWPSRKTKHTVDSKQLVNCKILCKVLKYSHCLFYIDLKSMNEYYHLALMLPDDFQRVIYLFLVEIFW